MKSLPIIVSVQEDVISKDPELYVLSFSYIISLSLSLSDTLCLVSLNVTTQHGAQ